MGEDQLLDEEHNNSQLKKVAEFIASNSEPLQCQMMSA